MQKKRKALLKVLPTRIENMLEFILIQGDPSRWELNPNQLKGIDQSRLKEDKDLAFSLMYPKVNRQNNF